MPRYLSKSQNYSRTVRQPITTLVQGPRGAEEKPVQEAITANFERAGVTAFERELAKERFSFPGQYEGEDPLRRISIYDTDLEAQRQGWDEETKTEVEANLDEGQNEWYFRLPEEILEAPWPAYDQQTHKQILEALPHTGVAAEYVLVYERLNKKRVSLIAELESAAEDTELVKA